MILRLGGRLVSSHSEEKNSCKNASGAVVTLFADCGNESFADQSTVLGYNKDDADPDGQRRAVTLGTEIAKIR